MNTGRYTRIRTRQHSDPLFPPHPSRNAFAIALTHSTIYTQQHSIHRFAESCHSSNLHSTPLHPTFKYINEYYNLHTHQRCLKSHFRSESPTSRFTTTFLHPTRHLLFIFPLSQPHLLSFWTNGKRSWLILCGRHLFLPISTLLLFIPFIIIHSNPSLLHSLVSKQTLHTHFNPSLPNTLLHNNQGNCLRSLMLHSLTRCKHTLHDQTRMTHQSPPYEPPRRSNNSRRTRLRHRTHLLNARVHCTALHCIATLNPD